MTGQHDQNKPQHEEPMQPIPHVMAREHYERLAREAQEQK